MHRRIFSCIGVVALVLLGLAATIRPTLDYRADTINPVAGAALPAQEVTQFLEQSHSLPSVGTGVERHQGKLQWLTPPENGPQITSVHPASVRVASGAPLLLSILDDDPTYSVEVEAMVGTSDGKSTVLRMTFWDYGLVTPWSVSSAGDGLKPTSVIWE